MSNDFANQIATVLMKEITERLLNDQFFLEAIAKTVTSSMVEELIDQKVTKAIDDLEIMDEHDVSLKIERAFDEFDIEKEIQAVFSDRDFKEKVEEVMDDFSFSGNDGFIDAVKEVVKETVSVETKVVVD